MSDDDNDLRELIKDTKHVCVECNCEFTIWSKPDLVIVYCPQCGHKQQVLINV